MVVMDKDNQRIVADKMCGDVWYYKNTGDVRSRESVRLLAPFTEKRLQGVTTSGGVPTHTLMQFQPPNKFQGKIAGFKGQKLGDLNEVGQNKHFWRRRAKVGQVNMSEHTSY